MIKFYCNIPENMQKSMANGDIRLQLDMDKTQAHVIPDLIKNVGQRFYVVMVTDEEGETIAEERKTIHQKLVEKVHVLWGQVAEKYRVPLVEYKRKYKEKYGINVSTKDLDNDSLGDICEHLEKILKGE